MRELCLTGERPLEGRSRHQGANPLALQKACRVSASTNHHWPRRRPIATTAVGTAFSVVCLSSRAASTTPSIIGTARMVSRQRRALEPSDSISRVRRADSSR